MIVGVNVSLQRVNRELSFLIQNKPNLL